MTEHVFCIVLATVSQGRYSKWVYIKPCGLLPPLTHEWTHALAAVLRFLDIPALMASAAVDGLWGNTAKTCDGVKKAAVIVPSELATAYTHTSRDVLYVPSTSV